MEFFEGITTVGLGTLIVLVIFSMIVIGVVIERLVFLRHNVVNPDWMHAFVAKQLQEGGVEDALKFVSQYGGLLPRVYEVGLSRFQLPQEAGEVAMSTSIAEQRLKLETHLPIISTIAVIAPFVGLFGTVVGIMSTFTAVAEKGQAGIAVVAAGVAEALVATAAGLFVAITAVVFFNYFKTRVSTILADMVAASAKLSEMMELVRTEKEFPEDLIAFEETED